MYFGILYLAPPKKVISELKNLDLINIRQSNVIPENAQVNNHFQLKICVTLFYTHNGWIAIHWLCKYIQKNIFLVILPELLYLPKFFSSIQEKYSYILKMFTFCALNVSTFWSLGVFFDEFFDSNGRGVLWNQIIRVGVIFQRNKFAKLQLKNVTVIHDCLGALPFPQCTRFV